MENNADLVSDLANFGSQKHSGYDTNANTYHVSFDFHRNKTNHELPVRLFDHIYVAHNQIVSEMVFYMQHKQA